MSSAGLPHNCSAAEVAAARRSMQLSFLDDETMHLAVSERTGRHSIQGAKVHYLGVPLPPRALAKIQHGLYALSPEATFLHLANSLPFEALVLLGFELCGSCVIDPDIGTFRNAETLTARDTLVAFANQAVGMHGRGKALRALRYVADGSASPAESKLAMLLCLDRTLGGYGMPLPQMNKRILVTESVRQFTPKQYFLCDLCWPQAKLDVEYDSNTFHMTPERLALDAARRNALLAMGYSTITVTAAQMRDADLFDDVARSIAKKLGVRYRKTSYGWPRARRDLRRRLAEAAKNLETQHE